MDGEPPENVKRLEEFLEERLKPKLLDAIAQRDKVFEKQKIFSDLRRNIENLEKNTVTSMKTLVNLGSEVYTEADAPDTRYIFVEVGFGFYVQLTWSEALNHIAAREKLLSRKIEDYTRIVATIKAEIGLVLEGIKELLKHSH
ncbi:Prefoldin chaperone subunit family protein [Perilla frutescens var. frutescens]|nr:Prefoldin chaperone subunit family protein [Perilla frutescens var. frutescens]